ncbi:ABC transporter ATP-binding protein [Spiroplasma sp. TIUS-1]|uniref:ABC transporter ATP-binding protein/permease n=1 Tax=Spiroplasma sp. TIUS-1 TaxID=216963 RepID=UPI0013975CB7|nr:ABC transporter ATP-binding protein/permease [Spiroplasma sp. TIUS-1]QHX35699.1 ABC transporter ATP-binding protein [Spiroplasma sp. TIUS-1]
MIDKNKPLVVINNVVKKYKDKEALKGVSLTINPGDRIGIIGANGSGKSTVSEIIGGIRKATSGSVTKQEEMVIGLQFQESKYPVGITVIDMLKYYLETFSIPMKESELDLLLKTYQISDFKNKFIVSLSGGQQQRLNILLSLIHNPDLVILDEVSTGLDIEVRSEIFKHIKEQIVEKDKALILVTHMMSEVEELCERFVYIHEGVIIEEGLVADIVKKYGSVHNYTWEKFAIHKSKSNLEREALISEQQKQIKKNKVDRIINDERIKGKNIPLSKLLFKYYLKGGAVPFFVFIFPIILLFLQGFAFQNIGGEGTIHGIIGALAAMQIIACGIFIIPQTILDFKNSVLMKRIGATNIKPFVFVLTVNLTGILIMILGFLWTLLMGALMFGWGDMGWSIAWANLTGPSLLFLLLILISAISLGMMLASIFKSTTTYIAVSNVIYMPVAFLSGSFLPTSMIEGSDVLKYATYINVFKYCLEPFNKAWSSGDTIMGNSTVEFNFDWLMGLYVGLAIVLICVYSFVSSRKMKWES